MNDSEDVPVEAKGKSLAAKVTIVAVVVALVVLGLLYWPAKTIEIDSPTLASEPTAEAYLANLDLIAAYAEGLNERKRRHADFRAIKFADYASMKAGAERMAAASPALRDDEKLWGESQRQAAELMKKLQDLDYALTASGL